MAVRPPACARCGVCGRVFGRKDAARHAAGTGRRDEHGRTGVHHRDVRQRDRRRVVDGGRKRDEIRRQCQSAPRERRVRDVRDDRAVAGTAVKAGDKPDHGDRLQRADRDRQRRAHGGAVARLRASRSARGRRVQRGRRRADLVAGRESRPISGDGKGHYE